MHATYPGATPEVIADTVAAPIEQEINGVEDMLYMTSSSTSDGAMTLTITFELGTNLDTAQVQVQNRVAIAESRLPEDVRRLGVVTEKSSPDLMIVVHLESPDDSLDQLYISNYALLRIRDVLARIDGVGSILVFGAREYSMRVWLDPERMAALNVTAHRRGGRAAHPERAGRRRFARRAAHGRRQQGLPGHGQQPGPADHAGGIRRRHREDRRRRAAHPRAGHRPRRARRPRTTDQQLPGRPARGGPGHVPAARQQRAADGGRRSRRTMQELSKDFPKGLAYRIVYNPTEFIAQSVDAVYDDHLRGHGAGRARDPALPAELARGHHPGDRHPGVADRHLRGDGGASDFSLNNLTLFGLVLAIGIVVDDAIVVVENIERDLDRGLSPAGCRAPDHDRGGHGARLDRAGADRGVHADGVPRRHHRRSSSASSP